MCASPAIAAHVEPTAEPLWNAFPLNPPGKRLVKTGEHHFVPPTTDALEAFVPASDRDPGGIFGPTLLCVLFAAVVAPLLLCLRRSKPPKPNSDGSDRLVVFSVIGAMVAAETLYAYASFTLVVPLLL